VAVTGISVDPAMQVEIVAVSADLSSLMTGILPFQGTYRVTGYEEAKVEAREYKPSIQKFRHFI
jgi:hypothetical protein